MSNDCEDKVRYSLSDKSGAIRFEKFDIVGAPKCAPVAAALRDLLLGRSLEEIDVEELEKMSCPGRGECIQAAVNIITECQSLFVHNRTG